MWHETGTRSTLGWSVSSSQASDLRLGGAGEGNRTLMTSLEGWGSAIELRPHGHRLCVAYRVDRAGTTRPGSRSRRTSGTRRAAGRYGTGEHRHWPNGGLPTGTELSASQPSLRRCPRMGASSDASRWSTPSSARTRPTLWTGMGTELSRRRWSMARGDQSFRSSELRDVAQLG